MNKNEAIEEARALLKKVGLEDKEREIPFQIVRGTKTARGHCSGTSDETQNNAL